MAGSSATTNINANSGGKFYVAVSWSETGTSTSNNTSTISVTGTIGQRQSGEAFWSGGVKAGQLTIYWHDNNSNTDQWINNLNVWEIGYDQASRSVSGSITVTHKADGTLDGYAFATWVKDEAGTPYYAPNSGSASTPWTALTTIPRKVEISSVTGSFTDENLTPTVTWTNNGNRVDLKIEIPSLGLNPWKRYNNLQGSSSYSPTFTQTEIDELLNMMPNSSTLVMRFTVTTVINNTDSFFSYLDKTFTIVNGEPVFSDFTYADTNATTTTITGDNSVMVSGKSTLTATISAANKAVAKKSATMAKYTFAIAGLYTDESYSASTITKTLGSPTVANNELPSATRDLTVSAIDSRGLSTAVTKAVTIVPYQAPIVNATATRVNGFENDTTIKISGTFSRIEVSGTAKNTVNSSSGVRYRYKAQSSGTWGSWINKTATVDTATGSVTVADFTLSLDNQTAYDIEVQIIDKLETTTVSLVVSVGQPAFFVGSDGRVSVGEMPTKSKQAGEKGLLEVSGEIYGNIGYKGANLTPGGTGTPADWVTLLGQGKSYVRYSAASKFSNQPATYGTLETICSGLDVEQVFTDTTTGIRYSRSGYDANWNGYTNGQFGKIMGSNKNSIDAITISATYGDSTASANSVIALNTTLNSTGTKLSRSDNGVKIGAGVSKVLVTASVFMSSGGAYGWFRINKNTSDTGLCAIANIVSSSYGTATIPPTILGVAENDILRLWNLDTIKVRGHNTYLTVIVLE